MNNVESRLNPNQQQIINTLNGNIAVVASAGSGKTLTLACRIKNLVNNGVAPQSILAITFSHQARVNMRNRLSQIGCALYDEVNIETFHSFALKIIKSHYKGKYELWQDKSYQIEVLRQILKNKGITKDVYSKIYKIIQFISAQKSKLIKPNGDLVLTNNIGLSEAELNQIYLEYESYKQKHKCIEFDDFILQAVDVLNANSDILHSVAESAKYLLVDEYQDVSESEYQFMRLLNAKNTMVVGDMLQAIYGFRGSETGIIQRFCNEYQDVLGINISTNYRCSQNIVDLSNKFAECMTESNETVYVQSVANRSKYKDVELYHFQNAMSEADFIGCRICDYVKKGNYSYKDIVVLSRNNALLQDTYLILSKMEVPVKLIDDSVFYELPEIKLVLSYLRVAADKCDDEAYIYLFNKPGRCLRGTLLTEIRRKSRLSGKSLYESMIRVLKRRNYSGLREIEHIIEHISQDYIDDTHKAIEFLVSYLNLDIYYKDYVGAMENIQMLICMCRPKQDVRSFLNEIYDDNSNENDDCVKLMTIHKSKGLEFPVVFLTNCNQNILPHTANDDEEKRIMYVAMTRAADELIISYSDYSQSYKKMEKSEFIDYLQKSHLLLEKTYENE